MFNLFKKKKANTEKKVNIDELEEQFKQDKIDMQNQLNNLINGWVYHEDQMKELLKGFDEYLATLEEAYKEEDEENKLSAT